ncbi:SymE family type I addiction module toxin [Xanthomonas translucens]|uniref:SymE family type I addiction module toxin n=1 Tax=Xanthomonas campestris pv. translucens TaxID=343 RepID=UPI00071E94EA|nr:SymE family type I addiction module toxin [Xanthomonas translucens]WLA08740.1 type I toxin-antitoxin system SymE family toxin [Xanthomonas translucens]
MRKPPSRPAATSRKRAPHQPAQFRDWTIVESTLTPMLTPEQIAAELAPEQARAPRAPRRTHPPQRCKMGYGYYPASNQVVPALRLRGRWLEQLGFAIGSTLRIEVRPGELVVRVADAY